MKKRQVFLDGLQVDVTNNMPAIMLSNPIFIDASEIKANRTETYSLLKTTNNIAVVNGSNIVGVDSSFVRNIHRVTESRDGVNIIENAVGRVIDIDETINMSVSWGSLVDFSSEFKTKLNELPSVSPYYWGSSTPYMVGYNDYGLLSYWGADANRFNKTLDEMKEYTHPSVSCLWLLKYIFQQNDIFINLIGETESRLQPLYIPLRTKTSNEDRIEDVSSIFRISTIDTSGRITMSWVADIAGIQRSSTLVAFKNGVGYKFVVDLLVRVTGADLSIYNFCFEIVYVFGVAGSYTNRKKVQYYYTNSSSEIDMQNGRFTFEFNEPAYVDPIEAYFNVYFVNKATGKKVNIPQSTVYFLGNIYVYEDTDLSFESYFPIVENLPNISCLDFIKNMLFLCGLYVESDYATRIVNIRTIDSQLEGIENAIDLNSFMLANNTPVLSFTFKDYAQRNYFKWKDDETVRTNADGILQINDSTLLLEKDIVELSFAASDNRVFNNIAPRAFIELYDMDDEGNVVYNGGNLSDRIIYNEKLDGETISRGYFSNELYFNEILGNYYVLINNILTAVKGVKITLELPDSIILKMQKSYKVFIFGIYFIVVDCEIIDNIATINLIRVQK